MRIVKRSTLATYWRRNPQAHPALLHWHRLAKKARWTSLRDVRAAFPHADSVTVKSGRSVVVFNVAGNKYRLITAIHYDRQLVFTLMVLSHAQYSRETWKDAL
jgi:mRNA interferase HigB